MAPRIELIVDVYKKYFCTGQYIIFIVRLSFYKKKISLCLGITYSLRIWGVGIEFPPKGRSKKFLPKARSAAQWAGYVLRPPIKSTV